MGGCFSGEYAVTPPDVPVIISLSSGHLEIFCQEFVHALLTAFGMRNMIWGIGLLQKRWV